MSTCLEPQQINAIRVWRQGDCVLSKTEFYSIYRPSMPFSAAAATMDPDELEEVAVSAETVPGLAVTSQTCDIVNKIIERPYLEVSPLIKVDAEDYRKIAARQLPQFYALPTLKDHLLVVDLDRTMTVEKSFLLEWSRTEGCSNHEERKSFATALARKRSRSAFPNNFVKLLDSFRKRCHDKHSKASPEGDALRKVDEIRVKATPDWNADIVEVKIWFLHESNLDPSEIKSLETEIRKLVALIKCEGSIYTVDHKVSSFASISAEEYRDADALEYDRLS